MLTRFVSLDIYGSGNDITWYTDLVKIDSRFKYHGPYNNNDLFSILRQYDIGFIFYPNDTVNNKFCAPNKFYDYVYSGLPIIGNNNYGLRQLVADNKIGCCTDDLSEAIEDVIENYDGYSRNMFQLSQIDLQYNNSLIIQDIYKKVIKGR